VELLDAVAEAQDAREVGQAMNARDELIADLCTMLNFSPLSAWRRDVIRRALAVVETSPDACPWRAFVAVVERERDATGDARRRELLARLAGSVRALGGIPRP
jgi:hypothetical protein